MDVGCSHLLARDFCYLWGLDLIPRAVRSACDDVCPSHVYTGIAFTKAPHPVLISPLSHEITPSSGLQRRRVRSRREETAAVSQQVTRTGTQACGWPGSLRQEWGTKPRQSRPVRITPPPSLSWSPGCCRLQLPLEGRVVALSLKKLGSVRPWDEAHSWIPRRGEARSPCHPLPPLAEEGPNLGHLHLIMSLMSLLVRSPDPSAPAPSFFLENLPVSCFPELPTCTASSPISPGYKSRSTSENAPGLPRYSRQPAIPLSWCRSPPCWSSPPPRPGWLHVSLCLPSSRPVVWLVCFCIPYTFLSPPSSSNPLQLLFPLSGIPSPPPH